jgi:hypothetical protein
VQTAFGFNNAAMQAKATATTFSLQAIEVYSAVCTFTTGEGDARRKDAQRGAREEQQRQCEQSRPIRAGPVSGLAGI